MRVRIKAMSRPKVKTDKAMRKCLGDDIPVHYFLSDGPGNRICPRCKISRERPNVVDMSITRPKGKYNSA